MDSQELIRLSLSLNQEGQKLLYERYVTSMARLCQRYLKDQNDVQDILIEGFMKVFNSLAKFEYRGEHSLEIWIRKIMINRCLMHLRKQKRILFVVFSGEETERVFIDQVDVHAAEIMGFIQSLPDGYRTIFNLFVIDGYTHKEIAELLGITESASRSQLTHARNKLKKLLTTHGWK